MFKYLEYVNANIQHIVSKQKCNTVKLWLQYAVVL